MALELADILLISNIVLTVLIIFALWSQIKAGLNGLFSKGAEATKATGGSIRFSSPAYRADDIW